MKLRVITAITFCALPLFAQKFAGLALTPPMGWNSWNKFGCDVNEDVIKAAADAMVASGMQEVGNGMSVNEDRAHFSMWCMLAAPLIAGNDLSNMSRETVDILTNREAIAVDQDSLGIQALKYSSQDSVDVWFKPLSHEDWAVCFLNRDVVAKEITFVWTDHQVTDDVSNRNVTFSNANYTIRDLWTKKEIGSTEKPFTSQILGHDVILLRLRPMN